MELKEAEQEKIVIAEKQISYVRAIIIVFGTFTFFMLHNSFINYELSYTLLFLIWAYGLFVILYKPYEKHPIFLAAWFTYLSDCIFATLWIYSTGGLYSPYHVLYYTSIVAVAFRFDLRTTMLTSCLYTLAYLLLLYFMDHLRGNEALAIVRSGFIFILGFLTNLITAETLIATRQKLLMKDLMEVAQKNHEELSEKQNELNALNSELKLRNDLFSHAEENASIGSYSIDFTSNKIYYSDNLYRILGYEPGAFEPNSEKFRELLHEDDKPLHKKIHEDMLLHEKAPNGVILRAIKKSGELCFLNITARFTSSGGNKILIGTLQDITNDVKMKEELQEKNRRLEQSNSELSSFSYVASHDLQEPVRKILTFAELILEKDKANLQETSKGYIERILGAAKRMKSLIQAFLNYSRIDNAAIQFEKTDLNAVLDEIKVALQDYIIEKNAIINSADLPVVYGIQFQMQQLFLNLVGNALKYNIKDQQPVITIEAKKVQGRQENQHELQAIDYWKISIQDNGIGFDPQYSEKIFEVFQRLHTKEQYEGTGIGLAICKKIVNTHRGQIIASSEQGKGAVFTIYLPVNFEELNKT